MRPTPHERQRGSLLIHDLAPSLDMRCMRSDVGDVVSNLHLALRLWQRNTPMNMDVS